MDRMTVNLARNPLTVPAELAPVGYVHDSDSSCTGAMITMTNSNRGRIHRTRRLVRRSAFLMFATAAILISGCSTADCFNALIIHGKVLVDATIQALAGIPVGGRSITDSSTTFSIEPGVGVTTAENGGFELPFVNAFVPCLSSSRFPRPDLLEIIIIRDGCEQQLMIEINVDTAQSVDGESPGDNIVELTEPILVPLCEPSP